MAFSSVPVGCLPGTVTLLRYTATQLVWQEIPETFPTKPHLQVVCLWPQSNRNCYSHSPGEMTGPPGHRLVRARVMTPRHDSRFGSLFSSLNWAAKSLWGFSSKSFILQVKKMTPKRYYRLEVTHYTQAYQNRNKILVQAHCAWWRRQDLCWGVKYSNARMVPGCIRGGHGLLRDNSGTQTREFCPRVPPQRSTVQPQSKMQPQCPINSRNETSGMWRESVKVGNLLSPHCVEFERLNLIRTPKIVVTLPNS